MARRRAGKTTLARTISGAIAPTSGVLRIAGASPLIDLASFISANPRIALVVGNATYRDAALAMSES